MSVPSRGKRIRVAEGVYDDRFGRAATVKVGRERREKRFPPGHDLPIIQSWQATTRAELKEDALEQSGGEEAPTRGTFNEDLPRYLARIKGRPSFQSDRSHLKAWQPRLGALRRTVIRAPLVASIIAEWQAAGKSARTLRHRLRVLRELYQTLDGPHARPPIKGVKLPRPPAPSPTPVPHALIRAVAKSLKAGKRHKGGFGDDSTLAYARFLVRATTGQRPSQIGRALQTDVDFDRRIWFVRPAKGGLPIPLPLDDGMMKAWTVFRDANAWGEFDSRSFSKTIRRHGWPTHIRPYNLRHTFAIDHLLAGTSIGDLQGLLGHAQIETTRRHYAPVLLALLRKAVGRRKLKLE